jgi:hypothetical protein
MQNMPKNGYNYDRLRISLERALSVLGDSSKQVLLFYMAEHYAYRLMAKSA